MRKKIMLLLALSVMIFGSMTVGTLANYHSVSSFGLSITPNLK